MDLHTITERDLVTHLALLDGWEDRYGYVIELGRRLPPMPDILKTTDNFVRGCTAQVWLFPEIASDGTLCFVADSDAHIVKGLIAILYIVFDGQPADKAATFDMTGYFQELGLAEHLTPNRRNGFFAMVERLKTFSD